MPHDKEIHIGFIGPETIDKIVAALGLALEDDETGAVDAADIRSEPNLRVEMDTASLEASLDEAYEAIVGRMGWTIAKRKNQRYYEIDTPYGRREAARFDLAIQYDPHETGDSPDEMTLGINLSARYYPSILDMSDRHGTMGSVIDIDALRPQLEICREEIARRIPAFSEARIFVRDIFY